MHAHLTEPSALAVLATLALLAPTPAGAPAAPDAPVHYTVTPRLADGALAALEVELRFAGDADGETRLRLPGEWAGTSELWRHVAGLTVEGAGAVREDGPGARLIAHAPGGMLTVRYRIAASAADPAVDHQKARPVVRPGWFFFHGEGVFATPEGRGASPARFAWKGIPPGWTVVSDLDHMIDGSRAGTVADVVESAALGGTDVTVVRREVDGAPLRVALRGSWGFAPDALADVTAGVLRGGNELWGDPGRPFVLLMMPLEGPPSRLSYTGSGRADGFTIVSTANFPLRDATRFLAHEYMHTWLPHELGGLPERDEASGYWFSEGLSDFHAGRALLRAGLWTFEDHVAETNRMLRRYATSPAASATAADVLARFWTDRDVQQLPYDRGHVLAMLLDHRLRQRSAGRTGLDEVLRAQRAAARERARSGARLPAPALFAAVLRTEAGLDVEPDVARHIEQGAPIELPRDLYGACALVETVVQPEFHRGFDIAATQAAGRIIAGVDPAGPAHAAGMRDGMRLIRLEAGTIGESTVEIAYRVADGDAERVIRYLPAGKREIRFQRIVPAPGAPAAACAALVSGKSRGG